jgi:hypothetical protein
LLIDKKRYMLRVSTSHTSLIHFSKNNYYGVSYAWGLEK